MIKKTRWRRCYPSNTNTYIEGREDYKLEIFLKVDFILVMKYSDIVNNDGYGM